MLIILILFALIGYALAAALYLRLDDTRRILKITFEMEREERRRRQNAEAKLRVLKAAPHSQP